MPQVEAIGNITSSDLITRGGVILVGVVMILKIVFDFVRSQRVNPDKENEAKETSRTKIYEIHDAVTKNNSGIEALREMIKGTDSRLQYTLQEVSLIKRELDELESNVISIDKRLVKEETMSEKD